MTPDDLQQLVPAFVGAALVILVVAGGILVFVWRQYASGDSERQSVRNGLRVSGLVVLALGVGSLCAGVVFGQAEAFGPASLLVPVAVAADGLLFLIAAQIFPSKS